MARLQDLPVLVELAGPLGDEVSAFVEDEAGWQVVGAGGPLRPVLAVTDRPRGGPPCVVVTDGTPAPDTVRAALLAGALDVVAWPQDRARLLSAPLRVPAAPRSATAPRTLGIAGSGGGAGTSTVALGAGALAAWSGARALVVGGDDLLALAGAAPWTGPGVAELAALADADAAAEVDRLVRPVRGVPGLTVLGGGAAKPPLGGWPFDLVVADLRAPAALGGADLVVTRADGSAAAAPASAPVIVARGGPLSAAEIGRILGRAPVAVLPESARVARAGLAGRVPASLPGSWMSALRRALKAVRR